MKPINTHTLCGEIQDICMMRFYYILFNDIFLCFYYIYIYLLCNNKIKSNKQNQINYGHVQI